MHHVVHDDALQLLLENLFFAAQSNLDAIAARVDAS
jgi:hypothetical protein